MGLTVRWAVGSPMKRPLQEKSIRMFGASLLGARNVWPQARRIVQVNNGPESQRERLMQMAEQTGCEVADGKELLEEHPEIQRMEPYSHTGRAWWKFLPPRFSPDDHELFLDADNVIWKEPSNIAAWRRNPEAGVLAHCETWRKDGPWVRHFVGKFQPWLPDDLSLNSGLYGFGPGVPYDPPLVRESMPDDDISWGSDQGFVAMNWWRGGTHAVTMEEVIIPFTVTQAEWMHRPETCGAHWASHSVQKRDLWTRYESAVMDRIAKEAL